MPGVAFTRQQQHEIAHALDELGVDEIELGFPASGEAQCADISSIVDSGLNARTLALARPIRRDLDNAALCGVDGVIIVSAFSDIHLRDKLGTDFDTALRASAEAALYARERGLFVQVSFEDATRTPPDRVAGAARALAASGAQRIGLADTVGMAKPEQFSALVARVIGDAGIAVAVHCHDDFGLAVANTLAAVESGATAISTTINGLGERSGNAATEECVAALEILYKHPTSVRLDRLTEVCRLVAAHSGVPIPANKGVVGGNSFRHESGIHVAAMLRNTGCYEPYPPALVGGTREYVLGKTSGRAAIRHVAALYDIQLDDEQCLTLLRRLQELSETGEPLDELRIRSLLAEVTR
ncbi:2-isopropylmalate synthase 1 [Phycicoccus elongatus Lp2]|uniref:2-isopropylmalate synthase 1 n=2 Tax=Phycicoccus elongatus TaxID=101689 RepID=N0E212_9MICO|nr:2-isopropylmalate synthase 1 [Phycicoccus elongatus Lp2]